MYVPKEESFPVPLKYIDVSRTTDTSLDVNSEEEESGEEETDLTAAFEREMDELASAVEELEDTLDVQDVEDLRELSESMYEGLATIRETHAKLRETTTNRGYQRSSSGSSHADFGSRQSSICSSGRGKGTVSDTGLVIRSVRRKTNIMIKHMSRVVLCRKQCMFTLSHLSRAQFRLNKSSEEPEHATLAAIAPLLGRCLGNNVSSLEQVIP